MLVLCISFKVGTRTTRSVAKRTNLPDHTSRLHCNEIGFMQTNDVIFSKGRSNKYKLLVLLSIFHNYGSSLLNNYTLPLGTFYILKVYLLLHNDC